MLSNMELEGMKHGCFNMAKDEGLIACEKYRAALEAQGFKTYLEWFANDLFIVKSYK